jgi:hypothetical protein
MARTILTEETRASLVAMAQVWLRLAAEQDDRSTDVKGAVLPNAVEESRSTVQQQQQVQPKDDDKKE